MVTNTCQVCGHRGHRGDMKKYHIVPSELMTKVGKLRPRKTLCNNCHEELDKLCSRVVADMTYDTKMKRFRARSPQEMVKEYEMAYQRFARYKKEQQRMA